MNIDVVLAKKKFTVTKAVEGQGTVIFSEPNQDQSSLEVIYGNSVSVNVSPADHWEVYRVYKVTVDSSSEQIFPGADGKYTIYNVYKNYEIRAVFKPKTHTIKINLDDSNIVEVQYDENENITRSPNGVFTVNEGYQPSFTLKIKDDSQGNHLSQIEHRHRARLREDLCWDDGSDRMNKYDRFCNAHMSGGLLERMRQSLIFCDNSQQCLFRG